MAMNKLKIAAVVLLTAVVAGLTVGRLAHQSFAVDPRGEKQETRSDEKRQKPADDAKEDRELIQGAWVFASASFDGKLDAEERRKQHVQKLTFAGERLTLEDRSQIRAGSFTLDPAGKPKAIDLNFGEFFPTWSIKAIYKLEKEQLTICFPNGYHASRPTAFAGKAPVVVFKREPAEAGARQKDDAERLRERRLRSGAHLEALALAMHKYYDEHNHLPPAAIRSKDGKPLLSWRVAILPYLGLGDLYKQFKLDESWDSPHNKTLLGKMPRVYLPKDVRTKEPHSTFYQVFVGSGTVFEPGVDIIYTQGPGSIFDASVNTIMIVEAAESVPWTKPQDLPYAEDQPLPELGGMFNDEFFHFVTADGCLHLGVKKGPNDEDFAKLLRLAITRNDGVPIDLDELEP